MMTESREEIRRELRDIHARLGATSDEEILTGPPELLAPSSPVSMT